MSALKNFGITFLVSALIFGVVAYFAVGFFSSTVSGILNEEDELEGLLTEEIQNDPDNPNADEDTLPEVEGESFTVLFAMTDKRDELYDYLPKEEEDVEDIDVTDKGSVGLLSTKYTTEKVKSSVILRVSKETGEYTFIPVPTASKVYTHGGAVPLEDVLCRYGKDYFIQKITAMTGIVPDYSVIVNITEMDDVLEQVGSFTCYIEEEIFSDGKDYFLEPIETTVAETTGDETAAETKAETKAESDKKDSDESKDKTDATTEIVTEEVVIEKVVDAGNVTVGPKNIEAILLFENYENGQMERSTLLVDILKGIIGRLSKMDEAALGDLYDELTGEGKNKKEEDRLIDTDMTKADLQRKAGLLGVFEEYETVVYEYPGTHKGGEFIPDIDKATLELMAIRIVPDPTKGQK